MIVGTGPPPSNSSVARRVEEAGEKPRPEPGRNAPPVELTGERRAILGVGAVLLLQPEVVFGGELADIRARLAVGQVLVHVDVHLEAAGTNPVQVPVGAAAGDFDREITKQRLLKEGLVDVSREIRRHAGPAIVDVEWHEGA